MNQNNLLQFQSTCSTCDRSADPTCNCMFNLACQRLQQPPWGPFIKSKPESEDQLAQSNRKCSVRETIDRRPSCSKDEGAFYLHLFKLTFVYQFYSRITTATYKSIAYY